MNSVALGEILAQFRAFGLENDVVLPENLIPDGRGHRFLVGKKLNGFYQLHANGRPCGHLQDWSKHDKPLKWVFGGEIKEFSEQERRQFKLDKRRAEKERQAEQNRRHQEAAERAQSLWNKAKPASPSHNYLTRKRIGVNGLRQLGDKLIAPIFDESKRLVNLQFIDPAGNKRFLKSAKKSGCFSWFGAKTPTILISEGIATAISLYEETGCQSFSALDAGNLKTVSEIIRSHRPDAKLIICGDCDASGKGQDSANLAALATNALVLIPDQIGDWNDVVAGVLS